MDKKRIRITELKNGKFKVEQKAFLLWVNPFVSSLVSCKPVFFDSLDSAIVAIENFNLK